MEKYQAEQIMNTKEPVLSEVARIRLVAEYRVVVTTPLARIRRRYRFESVGPQATKSRFFAGGGF